MASIRNIEHHQHHFLMKNIVDVMQSEIEKHKIEQARYEELCSQYSSSSQETYRSSSSQGNSQLSSQGDSQPHSSDYYNARN